MAVTMKAPAPGGLSNKARELMEEINAEAGKHNVWVRTQANAPAQRPWFSETSGEGSGQIASGRVAVAQLKTQPYLWRWKEYSPYLHQISEIAQRIVLVTCSRPFSPGLSSRMLCRSANSIGDTSALLAISEICLR